MPTSAALAWGLNSLSSMVPRLECATRSVSVASTNEKQLLNGEVMGSSKKLTLLSSRAERHKLS